MTLFNLTIQMTFFYLLNLLLESLFLSFLRRFRWHCPRWKQVLRRIFALQARLTFKGIQIPYVEFFTTAFHLSFSCFGGVFCIANILTLLAIIQLLKIRWPFSPSVCSLIAWQLEDSIDYHASTCSFNLIGERFVMEMSGGTWILTIIVMIIASTMLRKSAHEHQLPWLFIILTLINPDILIRPIFTVTFILIQVSVAVTALGRSCSWDSVDLADRDIVVLIILISRRILRSHQILWWLSRLSSVLTLRSVILNNFALLLAASLLADSGRIVLSLLSHHRRWWDLEVNSINAGRVVFILSLFTSSLHC